MSCRDIEALFVEQQDGRLDPAEELRLEAHLESCEECRDRARLWRALMPAMRDAAPPPPSAMRVRRMEVEIERRLAAAAPHRARPTRSLLWMGSGMAAVAMAAALLIAFWPARPTAPQAPVVAAAPFATVTASSGVGPSTGATLAVDRALQVPESAELELQLSALAKLRVVGPAALVLGGDPEHVRIKLSAGRIEAEVAHRRVHETFVVEIPDGRVEVRGTRLAVVASASGSSVRVDEGRVAVFDRDQSEHSVSAGETFTLPGPQSAQLTPDKPTKPHEQCSAVVDCSRTISSARRAVRAGDHAAAIAALETALRPRTGCPRPACAGELGYLRAEALRLAGQLDAAVLAYHSLDGVGALPATRHNARYAAAQLERRLGRLAAARADYEAALRAMPSGALREEAMLGAMEVSDRLGDFSAAQVAAQRYLHAFPSGFAAAQARGIISRGAAP